MFNAGKVFENKNAPWEIYDLSVDERETTDIAAKHPELVQLFEQILKKEHQSSHINKWEFVAPRFSLKD